MAAENLEEFIERYFHIAGIKRETLLCLPFIRFLNDNLAALAALPDGFEELVVAKLIRGIGRIYYEEKELQDFFEHLAAFCHADNGYSNEGKKDVLLAASDSAGVYYMDFVTNVVNLYVGWQGMLHAEGGMNEVEARLLQELAPSYHIPVPDGAGRLRPTEPEQEKIRPGWIDKNGYYDLHWIQANCAQLSGTGIRNYSMTDIVQFLLERIRAKKSLNRDSIQEVFNELSGMLDIECESGNLGEAAECARLNRRLERTGYRVKRKLFSSTFKEVYAATDEYGTELVLKRIVDEKVRRVLAERGGTTNEMVRKEFKSSPFRMLHGHVSPTVQLRLPDGEVCILEKKYDMTLEEFYRKMCAKGGIFGRKPETIKHVNENDDRWRSRLEWNEWIEIGNYSAELEEMRPYPAFETGVPTYGRDYVLLEPYLTKILRLAHETAQGLEYCHEKDIVHGDIKLDNIGVLIEGEKESALISDFGVATYDLPVVGGDALGGGLGRVYTKAPELFREGSHPSKATDAWSFGATLFYLFTGRYPFSDSVCNYNFQEEKRHYLEKVHMIVREGTVEEELKNAIEQYVPRAVEISCPEKCTIFDVGESLMRVLDACFGLDRKPWLTGGRGPVYVMARQVRKMAPPAIWFTFGNKKSVDYATHPFTFVRETIEKLQSMVEEKRKEVYESTLPPF